MRGRRATGASGVRYRVALKGLSAFECNALDSHFRLGAERVPAYRQVADVDDADFVVADADQSAIVDELTRRGRLATSVFVGLQAPAGGAAWMMRPIDPLHVLRELDALAALHERPPTLPPVWQASRPPSFDGPLRRASDSQFGLFDDGPSSVPTPQATAARTAPMPRSLRPGVLLVDGGDAATEALAQRLRTLGLEPARCRPGAPALARVARDGVAVVLIDLDAGDAIEVDGYVLCRDLKRVHAANAAGREPAVVLLSSQVAHADRVRATLAGADALVAKRPLDVAESDVRRLLERHGAL